MATSAAQIESVTPDPQDDSAGNHQAAEFDLPLSILDRLVESEIVPLDAKIKAVESWRREVAEARSDDPQTRALARRLAAAHRFLRKQRLKSLVMKAAEWPQRSRQWLFGRAENDVGAALSRPIFPEL